MARQKQRVLEYRNYDLPTHFPLVIQAGDEWHISPVQSQRLHFHNCLEIGVCLSDSGHLMFGEELIDFHAGDVTLIARNVPHTTWSSPGTESLWNYIFLNPTALFSQSTFLQFPDPVMVERMLVTGHLLMTSAECPWAFPMVRSMLEELQERPSGYQFCVRAMMAAFLGRALRVYQAAEPQAEESRRMDAGLMSISPALDYIQAHYDQDFPIETLAEICHLSPTHFRRLFQAQMNISPLAFLHQVRILRSCTLLRTTDSSIVDIANQVGYTSLSCFNRWFLQLMGCTPSAWRKLSPEEAPVSLVSYSGWSRAETTEEILARNT